MAAAIRPGISMGKLTRQSVRAAARIWGWFPNSRVTDAWSSSSELAQAGRSLITFDRRPEFRAVTDDRRLWVVEARPGEERHQARGRPVPRRGSRHAQGGALEGALATGDVSGQLDDSAGLTNGLKMVRELHVRTIADGTYLWRIERSTGDDLRRRPGSQPSRRPARGRASPSPRRPTRRGPTRRRGRWRQ